MKGSNLFMGNIGDSRAIMGSKDSNDSMVAIQLTVDLKPDLPSRSHPVIISQFVWWSVYLFEPNSWYKSKLLQGKLKGLSDVKVESLHCKMSLKFQEFGCHLMMPLVWQWLGHLGTFVWRNMEWSRYLNFLTGYLQREICSSFLPQMGYDFHLWFFSLVFPFATINRKPKFLLFCEA